MTTVAAKLIETFATDSSYKAIVCEHSDSNNAFKTFCIIRFEDACAAPTEGVFTTHLMHAEAAKGLLATYIWNITVATAAVSLLEKCRQWS